MQFFFIIFIFYFAVLAMWTSSPWQVLCDNEMKRETEGKVNGEPFKLPVSGGNREELHTLIMHQFFNRELHGKRRSRGESESEGNWKEREVRFIFSSAIQRD